MEEQAILFFLSPSCLPAFLLPSLFPFLPSFYLSLFLPLSFLSFLLDAPYPKQLLDFCYFQNLVFLNFYTFPPSTILLFWLESLGSIYVFKEATALFDWVT